MNEKIHEFWDWFLKNKDKYYELNMDNADMLISKIGNRIRRVDNRLSAVFSGNIDENGIREIVITAEGLKKAFPIVFDIVSAAPEMERWKVIALKPRTSTPGLVSDFRISSGGKNISASEVYFEYDQTLENKLDVNFYYNLPEVTEKVMENTFHIMDYLIGEYNVATKIGNIEFNTMNRKPPYAVPLTELPRFVDALPV